MKIVYDTLTDTLVIKLRSEKIVESDEDRSGVILDYSRDGQLVSLEVLNASARVEDPRNVTLTTS